jgi:hypothetical protein
MRHTISAYIDRCSCNGSVPPHVSPSSRPPLVAFAFGVVLCLAGTPPSRQGLPQGATATPRYGERTEKTTAELISANLLFGCDVMSVSGLSIDLRVSVQRFRGRPLQDLPGSSFVWAF